MNSKTITNRAANAAAEHDSDRIGRLSFHVVSLEAEVKSLCKELAQFKPVQSGTETTFIHGSCDLVVFYESDDEGDFEIMGVYANGMNVHELASEEVMDLIRKHVTDHAYVLRKQAEYDRAEEQFERRRTALNVALAQQAEQDEVGINGLTEAETNATMSVMGLSKPRVEEPPSPIYYMRDNHTFKKLSDDVTTALVEIETEFNAGYTYGTLCSKSDGFRQVHAHGENLRMFFLNACKERLESLRKQND
jgi:hypothetical protein